MKKGYTGVGKESPYPNWVSRFASKPASDEFWGLILPDRLSKSTIREIADQERTRKILSSAFKAHNRMR